MTPYHGYTGIIVIKILFPLWCSLLLIILDQVASQFLLEFDGLKDGLEVASTKATVVELLDQLDEDRWPVLERFREYLNEQSYFHSLSQLDLVLSNRKELDPSLEASIPPHRNLPGS